MRFLSRFRALLKKEFIQLLKSPKMKITIFGAPLIQLFLLGYAATMDLRDVPFGVIDHSNTPESRNLAAMFTGSTVFDFKGYPESEKDMGERVAAKEIKMALVIPETFANDLASGRTPNVQIILDGRNSASAGIAFGYASDVVNAFNAKYHYRAGMPVKIITRGWFNPNYNARWFMVSSLIATLTLLAFTLLVALSFAKEREGGTVDQLLLTPYSPAELLAAKGLASMAVGFGQMMFCLVFVLFWFKVPYQSEYYLLFLLFGVILMAAVGIGLLISVHCANLQQAMIMTFMYDVPCAALSGIATPIANMPDFIRKCQIINPVRRGIDALHRLFLEGCGFREMLPMYLILGSIGLLTFTLACLSFEWQRKH